LVLARPNPRRLKPALLFLPAKFAFFLPSRLE
jgi:hypothetical protein